VGQLQAFESGSFMARISHYFGRLRLKIQAQKRSSVSPVKRSLSRVQKRARARVEARAMHG